LAIDPLLVSAFWPPTTLTGLLVWISIVVSGIAYAYRRKRRFKEGARLQIHWVDFGTRTFATAVSTSLLLLQASGVQLFSPLGGAGTGQLYIAFGLIVSLAILVSNLRQKLDSFVVPKTLEEEPETVDYSPPMPPTVEELEIGHMVSVLKGFMNVWEQHERLSIQERLQSGYNVQTEAKFASSLLLSADARCGDAWDQELKTLVQITSDALQKFGISDIEDQASEAKSKDAYDKAKALLSLLKAHASG
jgi:hypothetical protein